MTRPRQHRRRGRTTPRPRPKAPPGEAAPATPSYTTATSRAASGSSRCATTPAATPSPDTIPMPRDNAETKARRYLTEGRLIVLAVDRGRRHIDGRCRGDGDHYHLGYDPTRGW
jgi:hypothetical protein